MIYIGTSGWQYEDWRDVFYPVDLPKKDWLAFYAQNFNTLEVNATFYHLMKKTTFENWRRVCGSNFAFSIKGSRFITHIKRLKDCRENLKKFFVNMKGLSAPAIILWQLPPSLRPDIDRLDRFISWLPRDYRYAFEFRHSGWFRPSVFSSILQSIEEKGTVVVQDRKEWGQVNEKQMEQLIKGRFLYLRFHGPGLLYSSDYSLKELRVWSEKIREWRQKNHKLDIYAYFNNDISGYAVKNGRELKKLLS